MTSPRGVRNDLEGQNFGRLVVLRLASREYGRGQKIWWAKCLCGNEVMVPAKSLMSGNTRSCGCFRRGRSRDKAREQARVSDTGRFISASALA